MARRHYDLRSILIKNCNHMGESNLYSLELLNFQTFVLRHSFPFRRCWRRCSFCIRAHIRYSTLGSGLSSACCSAGLVEMSGSVWFVSGGRHIALPRARRFAKRWDELSLFTLTAAMAAVPALAQDVSAASAGTVQLDTVDVRGKKPQSAIGPIDGYIASQSAAGTKTSTPLIKTPQAISVVGAKEIRDQQAQTVDEATRYAPGIHSQTFGADQRND